MEDTRNPNAAVAIAERRRQHEEAVEHHSVVSQGEWVKKRLALMEREKLYVREGDALAAEVRALPWVKIEKNYIFTSMQGDCTLSDLFGEHKQLFIKHFMMEPDQEWQCEGCTLESNHIDGLLPYFENHDMRWQIAAKGKRSDLVGICF